MFLLNKAAQNSPYKNSGIAYAIPLSPVPPDNNQFAAVKFTLSIGLSVRFVKLFSTIFRGASEPI